MERKVIKENYPRNKNNDGFLSGSTDLPVAVENNKLYVFTSDSTVFMIEDENKIIELEMPYSFENTLSLKRSLNKDYNGQSFFDSAIVVDEDENIYVLNLYQNDALNIHSLREDGTYDLVWEGKLPDDLPKKTLINTFEVGISFLNTLLVITNLLAYPHSKKINGAGPLACPVYRENPACFYGLLCYTNR